MLKGTPRSLPSSCFLCHLVFFFVVIKLPYRLSQAVEAARRYSPGLLCQWHLPRSSMTMTNLSLTPLQCNLTYCSHECVRASSAKSVMSKLTLGSLHPCTASPTERFSNISFKNVKACLVRLFLPSLPLSGSLSLPFDPNPTFEAVRSSPRESACGALQPSPPRAARCSTISLCSSFRSG